MNGSDGTTGEIPKQSNIIEKAICTRKGTADKLDRTSMLDIPFFQIMHACSKERQNGSRLHACVIAVTFPEC